MLLPKLLPNRFASRHVKRRVFAVVAVVWLTPLTALNGQEAADTPARETEASAEADRLVGQLADSNYVVRQRAARQLGELGLDALAAVEEGALSSDREVRYACERLLASIRTIDLKRRLAAFAAGQDEKVGQPLPYWDAYKSLVGDSPEARKLFVDMLNTEGELLSALDRAPRSAADLLSDRTQSIPLDLARRIDGNQEVPLATVATLLLVAGDENLTLPERTSQEVYRYCYQRSVQMALEQGPHKTEVRKLLGRWITRGEDWLAHNGLTLALQHGLEEGLVPARRIIEDRRRYNYALPDAVSTVARLGDESQIKLLEPLLEDPTPITRRDIGLANGLVEVQVRDIALAAAVHLSGQEFEDYGFEYIQQNPLMVFTPNSACFDSEKNRSAAFEKWREDRKARARAGDDK